MSLLACPYVYLHTYLMTVVVSSQIVSSGIFDINAVPEKKIEKKIIIE